MMKKREREREKEKRSRLCHIKPQKLKNSFIYALLCTYNTYKKCIHSQPIIDHTVV